MSNHTDLPYLIEMKDDTGSRIFEHFEDGTLVICPTLLISYFHMTKLTRHVFLSKLPLKVSKLIRVSLPVLKHCTYIYTTWFDTFFPLRFFYKVTCFIFRLVYTEFPSVYSRFCRLI